MSSVKCSRKQEREREREGERKKERRIKKRRERRSVNIILTNNRRRNDKHRHSQRRPT